MFSCNVFGSGEGCVALCTEVASWSVAKDNCADSAGGWQLAVFDDGIPPNLASVQATWIGLQRGTGTAGDSPWTWIDGTGGNVPPGGSAWAAGTHDGELPNTCAAGSSGLYYSDACALMHPFACTLTGGKPQ
jgi:hypothetical protein